MGSIGHFVKHTRRQGQQQKLVLQIGAAAQSVPFARFTVSAVSQDQVEFQGADFVHNITDPMPQHIMTATATHFPGCAYGCRRLHTQEE
jgi:hypothetical protein